MELLLDRLQCEELFGVVIHVKTPFAKQIKRSWPLLVVSATFLQLLLESISEPQKFLLATISVRSRGPFPNVLHPCVELELIIVCEGVRDVHFKVDFLVLLPNMYTIVQNSIREGREEREVVGALVYCDVEPSFHHQLFFSSRMDHRFESDS